MIAFVIVCMLAAVALGFLAVRNLGNEALFTRRSLAIGLTLSLVAVAGLVKSLEINQLDIASVILTAIVVTMITVSVHARSLRPQPVPVLVTARRQRKG